MKQKFAKAIYSISILLSITLLVSCVNDEQIEQIGNGSSFYMITTRAGSNDPSQLEDPDAKVHELRIIIFPSGSDVSVVNQHNLTTEAERKKGIYTVKFMMENKNNFDIYVIANETASNQINSDLSFLTNATVSRRKLEEMKSVKPVISINPNTQENGMDREKGLLMTALYKNVNSSQNSSGSGSEADPYILTFKQTNEDERPNLKGDRSAIELLRCMAKVEIIYKDIAYFPYEADDEEPYDGPSLGDKSLVYKEGDFIVVIFEGWKEYWSVGDWGANGGFKTDHHVQLINIPNNYSLFPTGKVQTNQAVLDPTPYDYHITENTPKADIEHFVLYTEYNPSDFNGSPIGGLDPNGYKICFYIPEYICPTDLADNKKPAMKFTYYKAPSFFSEDFKEYTQTFYFENKQKPTDYEILLGSEPETHADYNIYRNRKYIVWVEYQ